MTMGTLGRAVRKSRTAMIEVQADGLAESFSEVFGLRDGDYLEYSRRTRHGEQMTPARILSVVECYQNARGGYTARVQVLPLLSGGAIGSSRSVVLTTDKKNGKVRGWMCEVIVAPRGKYF